MGTYETTYLDLLFADAYMRSLWEGDGDGRGVTLFGWKEEKEEGAGAERERQQRRRDPFIHCM